jgi:hypothetical protein
VSEPRLGVPAHATFAYPPGHGRDLEPRRIEHLPFGITRDVTAILDRRAHPGHAKDTLGRAILINGGCCASAGRCPAVPPSAASSP